MIDIDQRLCKTIKHYWVTRARQKDKQGSLTGIRDYGSRGAVTGGAQIDAFIKLMEDLLVESGLSDATIYKDKTVLPGFFRPTKEWDIVVVADGHLLASIEFKSQAGPSYGNNFNNRMKRRLGVQPICTKLTRKGLSICHRRHGSDI